MDEEEKLETDLKKAAGELFELMQMRLRMGLEKEHFVAAFAYLFSTYFGDIVLSGEESANARLPEKVIFVARKLGLNEMYELTKGPAKDGN
jgi:hypothetical protein